MSEHVQRCRQMIEEQVAQLGTLRNANPRDAGFKLWRQNTLTVLLGTVAAISLLVGGIGIMNVLLASVSERTREIGLRMAVGARQSDIRQQFLIEAVLVCLLGGVLGIGLALLLGSLIGRLASDFQVLFSTASIVAAFACSTLIGVAFGFLPARNAAQLDPVEALARE